MSFEDQMPRSRDFSEEDEYDHDFKFGKRNLVHMNVRVGKDFSIGAWNVIEDGVKIGNNVTIENHCEIMKGTVIGDDCFIRSYTRLGPNNIIGKGITIKCAAVTGACTEIKDGAFIGPQTICFSDLQTGLSNTVIHQRAIVGGGCRIMAGITIGEDAVVGAGSVVTKEVFPGVTVKGVPAK